MSVNTGQARASWSPERQRWAWVVALAACWTRCGKGVDINNKDQLLFFPNETVFHSMARVGLELTLYSRMASNSQ